MPDKFRQVNAGSISVEISEISDGILLLYLIKLFRLED